MAEGLVLNDDFGELPVGAGFAELSEYQEWLPPKKW